MASRQVIWARRVKQELREIMGERCRRCGATEELEFDCIEPQGHHHHQVGTVGRATFYRLQHKIGNLQLLCPDCHSIKTLADHVAECPNTESSSVEAQPY